MRSAEQRILFPPYYRHTCWAQLSTSTTIAAIPIITTKAVTMFIHEGFLVPDTLQRRVRRAFVVRRRQSRLRKQGQPRACRSTRRFSFLYSLESSHTVNSIDREGVLPAVNVILRCVSAQADSAHTGSALIAVLIVHVRSASRSLLCGLCCHVDMFLI